MKTSMEFTAVVMSAHFVGQEPMNIGVLVLDNSADRIHFRFRTDVDQIADPIDREFVQGLSALFASMAVEMGAVGVLRYLEDCASNAIRLSDRFTIHASDAMEVVERAFANQLP